ncbi:kinase-like domain-containing protein [Zychaea mexicana]|uniref:kinase-like domain-containing protein n=1 Tax=Zychaea mexicana TaxID=64656 RepID=UPI0022FF440D|nr:kinase-like domain-containing protein [Zychaea mexicana]KAI9496624.1 kinase-like domain-containing protein [Zychaea mexicana]
MMYKTTQRHIDSSLESIDRHYLDRMVLADLVQFCQDRGLSTEGTKVDLIEGLLHWKEDTRPIPAPSTPQLFDDELPVSSLTAEQQRLELNSREFSALFLDGSHGLDIPYHELQIGRRLGCGGFKDCYAGMYKGEPVAIGELRLAQFNEMDLQEIKHEIQVLKQLRHENVIRFIGVCTNPQHLCIITELCTKGDLFDVIRKYKKPSFAQQVMYMYDIALGVSYLHQRRPSIIHRDLKSMNILISGDDRAKVNDFGLARIRPKSNALMHTQCGTPNWQAPEFWSQNPSYTEKVDVYACGLIFWEILTWNDYGYPYQDLSEHQLYVKVRDQDARPPLAKLINYYPRNLLVLITEMWEGDSRLRPSMTHVVERLSTYLN